MAAPPPARIAALAALSLLYIALYRLSGTLAGNEAIGFAVSILFLPAFVRLLGYLLFEFWSVPALFVAALVCVDLDLAWPERTLVAGCLALGGPLGAYLAGRLSGLEPGLNNLSSLRLLVISLGCSAGNALFYAGALMAVGHPGSGYQQVFFILIGDTLGTWTIIYLIKAGLTISGRALQR